MTISPSNPNHSCDCFHEFLPSGPYHRHYYLHSERGHPSEQDGSFLGRVIVLDDGTMFSPLYPLVLLGDLYSSGVYSLSYLNGKTELLPLRFKKNYYLHRMIYQTTGYATESPFTHKLIQFKSFLNKLASSNRHVYMVHRDSNSAIPTPHFTSIQTTMPPIFSHFLSTSAQRNQHSLLVRSTLK